MQSAIRQTELPDVRLKKRLDKIHQRFNRNPGGSIPQVMQGWSGAKGTYRFLDNERVTHKGVVAGQRAETRRRIKKTKAERVLLVQDTTSFNFSHHPETSGMGPLDNPHAQGFFAHSSLVVSEAGVPLGLWDQQVWVRDPAQTGKSHQRHSRPFVEKESYKWVQGLPAEDQRLPVEQCIAVCDREAHIYEFLDECFKRELDLIVRAMRCRGYDETTTDIFKVVDNWSVQTESTLDVPRRPNRPARQAQLELRWGQLTLKRPEQGAPDTQARLHVYAVDVREPHPPAGQEGIHWLLLTSLPVHTFAQAQQIITWYTYRWRIERFHYILKSGCRLEERQLQDRANLVRLLAVFNLIAWRLLWLTYQSRQTPHQSCTRAFSTLEWQVLYAHHHDAIEVPDDPPDLQTAIRWLAALGGFLGRKSDGSPGVKVLWRGWIRLQDFVRVWSLFHPLPQDVGNV